MNLKVSLPVNIEDSSYKYFFNALDKQKLKEEYIIQKIMDNFQIRVEDLPDRLEKKIFPDKEAYWVDGKMVHEQLDKFGEG